MSSVLQDLKYALRALRKSPGFTAVAVLTLALGIGANTTIFSLIDAVILRPPAHVRDIDRLVAVNTREPGGRAGRGAQVSSYPDYLDFAAGNDQLDGLASFEPKPFSVATGTETFDTFGEWVSANYFAVLGVMPARGRTFGPDDGVRGATPTAVISYPLWRSRFGGSANVIGRTVRIRGTPVTVIGVAPRGFTGTLNGIGVELWIPYAVAPAIDPTVGAELTDRQSSSLFLVGRLAAGATVASVQAHFDVLAKHLQESYPVWHGPRGQGRRILVTPEADATVVPQIRGAVVSLFAVLAAVAALVLVICCANLANLLLARGTGRAREMGVRIAIGAGRWRIVRQLLAESTTLAVLGGAGGVAVAAAAGALLARIDIPVPVPIALDLSPDWRVVAFAAGVAVLTGVVFGIVPALRATAPDVVRRLRDESTVTTRGRRRVTLRGALVVSQVAVSAVLLVVAGLFLDSLRHAQTIDLGFHTHHVALATIDLDAQGYGADRIARFYDRLETRVRALPGVKNATLAAYAPLGMNYSALAVQVEGYQPSPTEDMSVGVDRVGDGYFRTLGIAVLRGRGFTTQDRADAPRVAVVNEAFVHRFWPDGRAIGRHLRGGGGTSEVVGVVADAKMHSIGEGPTPFVYLPMRQNPVGAAVLAVRTTGAPAAMLPTLRRTVAALDPNLPADLNTMDNALGIAVLPQRVGAILLSAFGGLGMLLAALGLYGVLAYLVARRTREIGIRMALGSESRAVMRLVLSQAARLTAVGLVIGLVLALVAGRLIRGFLFGVTAADPLTFGGVLVVFAGVALMAGFLPARRATRIDPMEALRSE